MGNRTTNRLGMISSLATAGLMTASLSFGQAVAVPDEPVRFDGDQVIRASIENHQQLRILLQLTPDVWTHGIGIGDLDVRIPAENVASLDATGIEYEVLIEDVQTLIDAESERLENPIEGGWFLEYKDYAAVNTYMNDLAALRPDLAQVVAIGQSVEGRTIFGLCISSGTNIDQKPSVLMNACQHAREWVSVMTAMWTADRLIRDYDTDSRVQALVDNTAIYIVPIANPDGYEYTWTTNRLWRKNRSAPDGVDLNRNWSYEWGGVGTSGNEFSDLYRGPFPFSEPESLALSQFVEARPNITKHIDFHSYSQFVLHPWGFVPTPTPDDDVLNGVANDMADAILPVHGERYIPGQWYTVLYPSSGIMIDWMYAERGAISYTVELRPDTGNPGFILPPEEIIPTSEEAFEAALTMAEAAWDAPLILEISDLNGGQMGTLETIHADPGQRVYFIYSLSGLGSTPVPPLGVTLDLDNPVLGGSAVADASGVATFTTPIPNVGLTLVWVQAAVQGRTSAVVLTQIN